MTEITAPIKVDTFVGDLEVIGNGIVHVSDAQPLNLQIGGLKMRFIFSTDNSINESRWSANVEDNSLTWRLVNFNNALGQGLLNPIKLGSLNKRELLASFFVWVPNSTEGLRIVNYVIYSGQKTDE